MHLSSLAVPRTREKQEAMDIHIQEDEERVDLRIMASGEDEDDTAGESTLEHGTNNKT
jgi:hypothetical protein